MKDALMEILDQMRPSKFPLWFIILLVLLFLLTLACEISSSAY